MKIKTIRWKKWLTVAVVLGMIAAGPGSYFTYHYGRSARNWSGVQYRFAKYHLFAGLEQDLAKGNIKTNDSVDSLLQKYPELKVESLDDHWVMISYQRDQSPTLYARNGKLVHASILGPSYTDTFFQMNRSDTSEFNQVQVDYYLRQLCHSRDQETLLVATLGAAARIRFSPDGNYWFPDLNIPPRD